MSNLIKITFGTPDNNKIISGPEADRIERIRTSLEKINRLMNELRNYNGQEEETT